MREVMSARQLADVCYKENCPIDWKWLNYLRKEYNRKDWKIWAVENIESVCMEQTSPQKIGRAANILLDMLGIY